MTRTKHHRRALIVLPALALGTGMTAAPLTAAAATCSPEVARHGVASPLYQSTFDSIVRQGCRPVWVDGFDVNGRTYFNAIFRPTAGIAWVARHGLSAAAYQAQWDLWVGQNHYRPTNLDVYLDGGSVRYAVIFVKAAGPAFVGYHGVSAAVHQVKFDTLTRLGYRPTVISAVSVAGNRVYAALYEKKDVGTFIARSFLTPGQYQVEFTANALAGRKLVYVNAYTHLGSPRMIGIWWQNAPGGPAKHGLSSAGYQVEWQTQRGFGRLTRSVTGYEQSDQATYAAFWTF